MQMPVEVPVEQRISSTSEEEELKSNDTTSIVAPGTGTPDMSLSLVRTAESTSYVVSLLYRTFDMSSHFRLRHWIDAVDTLL